MDVISSLKWRYATKKFDADKLLTEEKLDILKEAFNLTATSYGLQPVRMVVVSDKALQQRLKEAAMNQSQVLDASHVLIICVERKV
ncbi:MAG: NAD(P)H-dependent oxidoreductase, partial [Leeuwenhoekiella sp.]|nr:NAD(P)H-dependent oxidoreductase [Leeuwenhoekiella sp.]